MKSLRIALPVLLVVLIWWLQPPYDQSTTSNETSRPESHRVAKVSPTAPDDFADWLTEFQSSPVSTSLINGIDLAKKRRATLKRIIETDPARALQLAIPDDIRAGLPDDLTEHLETPVSAAGEFERIVSCYTGEFERPLGAPDEETFVTIKDKRYRAFTHGSRSNLLTKDRISIHGIAIDNSLALSPDPIRRLPSNHGIAVEVFGEKKKFDTEEELDQYVTMLLADENSPGPGDVSPTNGDGLPVANSAWTEGNKRILYLRVRFADQDPTYEPVTLATAQSHQDDVAENYRIASYGKLNVTTVFPDVITLTENKSGYVGQGLGKMMNEARDAAIVLGDAQGVDWNYNNFDFYTIVSDGGIGGYAGIAQVGGRKSHHQKGYTSLRTSGHEFGHNLGLSHAYYNYTSDLNPRGATPTNGLGRVEYAHRFSLMSAQSGSDLNNPALPHFTVHEKWRLDWLTDDDFVDITSGDQSGTYRLYQNDQENATGTRALRLPSGGSLSKYWLSYRTAWAPPYRSSANDYLLNGVLFNWTGSGGGTSTLLDMTPYSDDGSTGGATWTKDNNDKWDAPLIIGRTYTDPESKVSVTPIARGGSAPDEYLDVYVHLATGSEVPLVTASDSCTAVIPDAATATGTDWTAVGFDDSSWPYSGNLGVGYDTSSTYLPYFDVNVIAMRNNHESCYIRIPFTIDGSTNLADISSLKLNMRYDDGFVAYLNGVKIAEANAPGAPDWNSGATSSHSDSSAVNFTEFSANAGLGALVNGTNILAIHGLNRGAGSSDFLIQPTLSAVMVAGGNSPPSVSLSANTLVVGTNQDVTFTANGSDPDGDTLAYAWDFDINDTFAPEGLNQPTATRLWTSSGIYTVTVTCSDRKGGISRDRVVVKVGNPSNEGEVSGRVLRGGQPVAGARVFIDGTDRQTFTLEDGSYVFGGLSESSSTTIGAMFDGEVFQSTLAMPITPQPQLNGVDFLGHTSQPVGAPSQALTLSPHQGSTEVGANLQLVTRLWDNTVAEDLLIPLGDTWNYLDTGVAPAANWMDPGFDDSSWLTGAAELGYGDSQTTVVSFGADSANKHITTWFRRSFNLSNSSEVTRLKLSVKRDDGVRVFLNGTEIARDNLTTGTVSATTEASNDVSSSNEEVLLHFNVDPSLLVEGNNVVAAEIHQEDGDSSDLSFDLQLSASRNLEEVSPAWSVEPAGAAVSPAGEFAATSPGTYTVTATSGGLNTSSTIVVISDNEVSISANDEFLWENGSATSVVTVSRTGSTTGSLIVPLSISGDASAGNDFVALPANVTIPAGQTSVTFNVTTLDDSSPEGNETLSIVPVTGGAFSPGDPAIATITILDDEPRQQLTPDAGSDATVGVGASLSLAGSLTGSEEFISADDYWKFNDGGSEPSAGWKSLPYDDSGWSEGLAKFGYGDNNEATTVGFGSNSSSKHITTYFRRRFYVDNPSDYSSLNASLLVDDGAVLYLNGIEVQRVNMPTGTVTFSTRASGSVGGSGETTFTDWSLDSANLVTGENIIAVEVHQSSPTSSDLGFNLALFGALAGLASSGGQWVQISGPGTATFSNDEDPATSVSFDQAGAYVIALEANGLSDQITVTVEDSQNYASWVTGFTLSDIDPLADPDLDGTNNLIEFATVSNPSDGSDNTRPVLSNDPGNPDDLLFSYRRIRPANAGDGSGQTGNGYAIYGINYTVEASTSLTGWQPAANVVTVTQEGPATDNGDGSETITLRLSPPANSGDQWFARLRVILE
ncbi:MAG: PKD domain-containing protein [Akkermansiaceae bacterium]